MVSAGKNIDFPGFCVPRIYVSLQEDKNNRVIITRIHGAINANIGGYIHGTLW
jgi:hypothetical protein